MNTTENNKKIAEFMGIDHYGKNEYFYKNLICNESNMRFDSDWNWLMEVVEKIESLTDIDTNGCFMELESIGFNAKFILDDGTRIFKDNRGETKIEAVYKSVIAFIDWYNENAAKEN